MNNKQLTAITKYIANEVIRNDEYVMDAVKNENIFLLLDIIASLHNLLCEEVTGNRYNYMEHWSNKEGYLVDDAVFDDILKGSEENEH